VENDLAEMIDYLINKMEFSYDEIIEAVEELRHKYNQTSNIQEDDRTSDED
jgi:hypothetical protein